MAKITGPRTLPWDTPEEHTDVAYCAEPKPTYWVRNVTTDRNQPKARPETLKSISARFNPLIPTLKPQSKGPLYSNTVIGTLAVDGAPPRPLLAVPNVTAHPSTASVPTSYYLMWHYNGLWTLKGYTKVRNCMTLSGCFAMTGWQISDGLSEVCSSRNSNDRVRLHATFHHVTSMTLLTSPTCLFAVCYALVRVHASRVKCIVTCKKARWYVCVYVDAFVCSDGQYLIVLWLIT